MSKRGYKLGSQVCRPDAPPVNRAGLVRGLRFWAASIMDPKSQSVGCECTGSTSSKVSRQGGGNREEDAEEELIANGKIFS